MMNKGHGIHMLLREYSYMYTSHVQRAVYIPKMMTLMKYPGQGRNSSSIVRLIAHATESRDMQCLGRNKQVRKRRTKALSNRREFLAVNMIRACDSKRFVMAFEFSNDGTKGVRQRHESLSEDLTERLAKGSELRCRSPAVPWAKTQDGEKILRKAPYARKPRERSLSSQYRDRLLA
ncbi:hypothetical protein TNCV_3149931 [Trichonephila clavipes]|nr:hypothetical protein TNCV_3149931 [Trichonephila clavipes]